MSANNTCLREKNHEIPLDRDRLVRGATAKRQPKVSKAKILRGRWLPIRTDIGICPPLPSVVIKNRRRKEKDGDGQHNEQNRPVYVHFVDP